MTGRTVRTIAATLVAAALIAGPRAADAFFGHPDPTFGGTGIVRTNGPGSGADQARDVVALPDGKLLVAGSMETSAGGRDFALVKYNEDGSLDTSFGGGDGIVTTDVDGAAGSDVAAALAVHANGLIVLAGATRPNAVGADEDIAVVRYETDGSLDDDSDDDGFSGDGILTVPASASEDDAANDVLIDSSHRILLAGRVEHNGGDESDFVVVRIGFLGVLDNAFDGPSGTGDGIVRLSFFNGNFSAEEANGIDLADDGDLIVGGNAYDGNADEDTIALARLDNSTGLLDTGFDGDGLLTTQLGGSSYALALVTSPNRLTVAGQLDSQPMIAQFDQASGGLVTGFGTAGVTVVPGSEFGAAGAAATDLARDGSRYVVSLEVARANGSGDVGAARFTGAGEPADDLGPNGVVTTSTAPASGFEAAFGVTALDDGDVLSPNKVVLVGRTSATTPDAYDLLALRYGPDVTPPTTTITRPRKRTKDRTPALRFKVSEEATSRCRVDGRPWIAACTSPRNLPRLSRGRHVVRVQSTDLEGNVESPPAKRRFKVVR